MTMTNKGIWQYKRAPLEAAPLTGRVHMVGVKGVGMAALAELLVKNGITLTGSDVKDEFMTDEVLARLGIPVADFNAANLTGKDAVIRSNAYTEEHVEVKAALDAGLPVFSYPQVVAELFNAHYGVAVAGSHGKTTTTAMLAHIFKYAGTNVSAIVGSRVLGWGSGALAGDLSDAAAPFVLEADEYKEAFLNYRPKAALITNIDWDHPDYFKTPEAYERAFEKFIALLPADGFLVVNGDDAALARLAGKAPCETISVSVASLRPFSLKLPGAHYQFDANLAFQAALKLGIEEETARRALEDFSGTARRMELVGMRNDALIFDDYAHHPTEIKATLAALKAKYPNEKLIAVFQPHTFSRTKALFDDFAHAFADADLAIFAGVYPSAREKKELAAEVDMGKMALTAHASGAHALYIKDKADIYAHCAHVLEGGETVIVTLGAGDIWQVARDLAQK